MEEQPGGPGTEPDPATTDPDTGEAVGNGEPTPEEPDTGTESEPSGEPAPPEAPPAEGGEGTGV